MTFAFVCGWLAGVALVVRIFVALFRGPDDPDRYLRGGGGGF
jgi:hypothetical protein